MRFFWVLLVVLASWVPAAAQSDFIARLVPNMEASLRSRTGLREVGFTLEQAPDGRLVMPDYLERVVFFQVREAGGHLTGRVLSSEDRELVEEAAGVENSAIEVFPFPDLPAYAVFVPARSNLGVSPAPAQGKNLATQARMGETVQVLERSSDGEYYRVRMESDGYIAWARVADLRVTPAVQHEYRARRPHITLQQDFPPLFLGTRLPTVLNSESVVELPNGTELTVGEQPEVPLLARAREFLPGGPNAVTTYLWGGSVGHELDCSGYVQTLYRLQGLILPRDADLQQAWLEPVAPTLADRSQLEPGDLIFFSQKREYADHVGLYLGDGEFIHCSSGGAYPGVKVSRLDGGDDYDQKLQSMYYGAGRPEL